MVARKPLRAVAPGEAPADGAAVKRPKSLLDAVAEGDFLAELRATHERIAKAVNDPDTNPRDLAALTRRQLEVSREIRAIMLATRREGGGSGLVADESWDAEAL